MYACKITREEGDSEAARSFLDRHCLKTKERYFKMSNTPALTDSPAHHLVRLALQHDFELLHADYEVH